MSWVDNIKSFFGRTDSSNMDEIEADQNNLSSSERPGGDGDQTLPGSQNELRVPPPASRPAPRNRRDRGKLPHHRKRQGPLGPGEAAEDEDDIASRQEPLHEHEEAAAEPSSGSIPESPVEEEFREKEPHAYESRAVDAEPLRSEEIRKGLSIENLDPEEFGGLDPVDCLLRMIDGLGFYGEIDDIVSIEGGYLIALHSEDPGRLIGRHGTVLNELQFLLNRMVQKGARGSVPRLILDVDGYRDRQEERLIDMALDAAERVRRWGHPIRIEPLNAYERRIVHNTLKSDPDIETISPNMADPDGRKQITVRMVK